MARRRDLPGWGWWIDNGATTLWEDWKGEQSLNHVMFGDISNWMFQWIAGIGPDPDSPGFDVALIRPGPVGDLTWAKAWHETPHGRIAVSWKWEGQKFRLELKVPANASAKVWLPAASAKQVTESGRPLRRAPGVKLLREEDGKVLLTVGSGTYHFVADPRVRPLDLGKSGSAGTVSSQGSSAGPPLLTVAPGRRSRRRISSDDSRGGAPTEAGPSGSRCQDAGVAMSAGPCLMTNHLARGGSVGPIPGPRPRGAGGGLVEKARCSGIVAPGARQGRISPASPSGARSRSRELPNIPSLAPKTSVAPKTPRREPGTVAHGPRGPVAGRPVLSFSRPRGGDRMDRLTERLEVALVTVGSGTYTFASTVGEALAPVACPIRASAPQ